MDRRGLTRRLAMGALGAGAALGAGSTAWAAGAAAAALSDFLAAFNSGDAARLGAFLTERFAGAKAGEWRALQWMSGGFDLVRWEEAGETRAVAVAHERDSDRYLRITLEVEAAASHRITALSAPYIGRPPYAPAPDRLTAAALAPAVAARMGRLAANGRLSGAVLVALGQRVVLRRAYGLADREAGIANSVETRFRIGSMNKMFTAVAALQLAQAGRLKLDAPIGAYLPDYPSKAFRESVTLAQLLSHTAGAGDVFGPQFDAHRLELKAIADYVALYGARDPAYRPGDHFDYANYGFELAGYIVERVSGQDYYDYVERHVFRPAGMTSTGSLPEDVPVARRAVGYLMRDGVLVPNTDTLPYRGGPAGGGYSTVGDMEAFARALMGGRLLDAAHTELMLQGHVQPGPDPANLYGYGMEISMRGGRPMVGHGGGAPGMNGQLWMWPKTGSVAVVLTNFDPPMGALAGAFIALRMPLA